MRRQEAPRYGTCTLHSHAQHVRSRPRAHSRCAALEIREKCEMQCHTWWLSQVLDAQEHLEGHFNFSCQLPILHPTNPSLLEDMTAFGHPPPGASAFCRDFSAASSSCAPPPTGVGRSGPSGAQPQRAWHPSSGKPSALNTQESGGRSSPPGTRGSEPGAQGWAFTASARFWSSWGSGPV